MKPALARTTAALFILSGGVASVGAADNSMRSAPPDLTNYARPATANDRMPPRRAAPVAGAPTFFVVDTVVNNTDPNLKNTDTFNDGETSISVNPSNPNQIAITAFSGGWGATAPIWVSENGGVTWTKRFTINPPPGVPGVPGGPFDQTIDFSSLGRLGGTFLTANGGTNVYSAFSSNLNIPSFNFFQSPPGVAQSTNHLNGVNAEDQPWLLVARRPVPLGDPQPIEKVYVAYDDFNTAPDMHVAVAAGDDPMQFSVDRRTGFSIGSVNPGHRLATDPRNGWAYSLFQRNIAAGAGGSKNIDYMLNRSIDGGLNWSLNGNVNGIIVANGDSTQPTPKFCTVNALLGGADHAAVDPINGDVYYVYGRRDAGTGNNRLAIRKLTDNGAGGLNIGAPNFVTGQVQAAIPSVAVTVNHTIGVFYYTCDSTVGFPTISAHFAISTNGGTSFTDTILETFLSSAVDNGNSRQRVLGDYQQVKALGNVFFGSFTGNGVPFGRPFSNHDPIFFKVSVP